MTRLGLIVGAIFALLGAVILAFALSTGARAKCSALDVTATRQACPVRSSVTNRRIKAADLRLLVVLSRHTTTRRDRSKP